MGCRTVFIIGIQKRFITRRLLGTFPSFLLCNYQRAGSKRRGCSKGYMEQNREWQPALPFEINEGAHKWRPSPPATLESHTE